MSVCLGNDSSLIGATRVPLNRDYYYGKKQPIRIKAQTWPI